jgi:TolB protein
MRKITFFISFLLIFFTAQTTFAMLNLELTQGVAGAVPIAVVPFNVSGQPSQDVSGIIANDLKNSGRFKVRASQQGVDNIVVGEVRQTGSNHYKVSFKLLDAFKGKGTAQNVVLTKTFDVPEGQLRLLAHHISDLVYQQILGVRGIFSTRLAYIVVQHTANGAARYVLEVCDQDGYNPRPLLSSPDPIMSPAWSPNGRQLAYVSFENKHASIYVQDVASGARRLISSFPGINGAPAWSPNGRQLALVLSKSGTPNIYIMDLATHQLTQLTHDYNINTEPSWSPNGRSIVFTSNRSGHYPQIYQINLANKAISRVTYDGNYNARASFTADGSHIVVLNRESDVFNIGILDLDTGTFRVLTNSGADSESPSVAPNGSMVLYGTLSGGRSVLGMSATDGSVQIRLPSRNGDVQDPSWSPFIS